MFVAKGWALPLLPAWHSVFTLKMLAALQSCKNPWIYCNTTQSQGLSVPHKSQHWVKLELCKGTSFTLEKTGILPKKEQIHIEKKRPRIPVKIPNNNLWAPQWPLGIFLQARVPVFSKVLFPGWYNTYDSHMKINLSWDKAQHPQCLRAVAFGVHTWDENIELQQLQIKPWVRRSSVRNLESKVF